MDFTTKKAILFDLDGTLTDSCEGIINSIVYTLDAYGVTGYDRNDLYRFVGPPLTESFKELLCVDGEKVMEAVEKYREYFRDTGIFENRLYDGVESLLNSLANSGKKIILATSKAEAFAVRILEHFNILQYFEVVAGSELSGERNKKDEVIKYALDKAGLSALNDAVMVGDRKYDITGAKRSGIDSIGILYGYGSREELEEAGATAIAETVEELKRLLLGK